MNISFRGEARVRYVPSSLHLQAHIKSKIKLHTSKQPWHKVNIFIPKGRNRSIERRDGAKSISAC
jgi:hypothetical protein